MCAELRTTTGKAITHKDVHNLRAKFNKERKGLLSDEAYLLQELKNISHSDVGAITQVLTNENGEVFAVYLQTSYMQNVFKKFQILDFIALSCGSEDLFVKFPLFLVFFAGIFFGYIHFYEGRCCCPRKYQLVVDVISVRKLLFIATTYFMDQTSTIHSMDTGFIYAVFKLSFSKQYKINILF